MPQYLKDDIRERILLAAARVFAQHDYASATMRQVAHDAGVSTGNVYRYFDGKEALFAEVLPSTFVQNFEALVRQRIQALRGVSDVSCLAPDDDYHLISEALLRFCMEHRLQVVVLLAKSQGSVHASFGEQTIRALSAMAIEHAASVGGAHELTPPERFTLEQIYRNFVVMMVRILAEYDEAPRIRAALRPFERYHLAGLKSFFEGATS